MNENSRHIWLIMTSYLHLKSIITLLKIKMHKKNYVNAEN